MGVRITGGDDRKKQPNPQVLYPKLEVGCLNTRAHKHHDIVNFVIPAGRKNAKCPECGRRAGRK